MAPDQYVWGRHYRALIAQCAQACPLSVHELAQRCGYRNISKFQRRRRAWSHGCADRNALILKAYLDAIQIDWCALVHAVERDAEEYDAALDAMPTPEDVITYARLGAVRHKRLPKGLSEAELYVHCQGLADSPNASGYAALDWPGMKQVWFRKGEEPDERLCRPRILLDGDKVYFGERSRAFLSAFGCFFI